MKIEDIDDFTRHYLIAALWSTTDEDAGGDLSLLDTKELTDIAPETVQKAFDDCADFQNSQYKLLKVAYIFYRENGNADHPDAGSAQACAGHDFWLTRNGHGVGFWDRGMGDVGERLTEACKPYGSVDLYVGDDGKVHS